MRYLHLRYYYSILSDGYQLQTSWYHNVNGQVLTMVLWIPSTVTTDIGKTKLCRYILTELQLWLKVWIRWSVFVDAGHALLPLKLLVLLMPLLMCAGSTAGCSAGASNAAGASETASDVAAGCSAGASGSRWCSKTLLMLLLVACRWASSLLQAVLVFQQLGSFCFRV